RRQVRHSPRRPQPGSRSCWQTDVTSRAGSPEPRAQSQRPRVGISRCLLGDAVRYDGTDKRADDLLRDLGARVEWIPVCPEVEVGMGTPREPIQLVAIAEGIQSGTQQVRLIGM